MLTPNNVLKQINQLTSDLIKIGLCESQNFPSHKKFPNAIEKIGITEMDSSIFLKSIPYNEMYEQLAKRKLYNIKMIDGALITMYYCFENNKIISHRLSFFPSPNLESFQNEPDLYFNDEIYSDILDRRIVTIPFRFDFDKSEKSYQPISHPISHFTMGQYENCRIPVTSALTPYQFLLFIIMNFYHTAYEINWNDISVFTEHFNSTIFDEEEKIIHIHTFK